MKILKIQSKELSFGTKVRMSPNLVELYSAKDKGVALRQYIAELEENKKSDILSISYHQDKSFAERILVDVFMNKNNKVYKGATMVLAMPKTKKPTCINLAELYKKVAQQMKKL